MNDCNEKVREALEFYGIESNWMPEADCEGSALDSRVCDDNGFRAREALAALYAEAVLTKPVFHCQLCGPGVKVDEDGCCAICGSDTTVVRLPVATDTPPDLADLAASMCMYCDDSDDSHYGTIATSLVRSFATDVRAHRCSGLSEEDRG